MSIAQPGVLGTMQTMRGGDSIEVVSDKNEKEFYLNFEEMAAYH